MDRTQYTRLKNQDVYQVTIFCAKCCEKYRVKCRCLIILIQYCDALKAVALSRDVVLL